MKMNFRQITIFTPFFYATIDMNTTNIATPLPNFPLQLYYYNNNNNLIHYYNIVLEKKRERKEEEVNR
jgi:hypothetical protein